jgi:superfamily II DNA or RNA helicase
MTTINITPKNGAYVYVDCSDLGVLMELQEELEFFADDYKYHPKFKKGFWDGKIRLYSPYEKTVYAGLVSRIAIWAQTYGYEVNLHPSLIPQEIATEQEVYDFVTGLKLTKVTKEGVVKDITPYTFQWVGVYYGINDRRRVFEASTAGGKSLILYMLARWHQAQEEKPKILIVTDTTNLVAQLEENFEAYSMKDDTWDVKDHVHQIYSGQDKHVDQEIYVSTWASMGRMPAKYFHQFTMVMIDEAHKAKAETFRHILSNSLCVNKIGVTGTLGDLPVHQYVIEGLIGPAMTLLTNKEGRDLGITSEMQIEGVVFQYSEEDRAEIAKMNRITVAERKAGKKDKSYPNEIEWLINHPVRNQRLCDFIAYPDGNSIALFTRIEHGMVLFETLKKQHPDRKVFFISGDVAVADRERLRQIMKTETNAMIVASFGTFSTGVDISNLHQLFICSPIESPIRLMQSLGRVGRLDSSKDIAKVYHFGDDLRRGKAMKVNHTLRHFKNCFLRYDKEQIPYNLSQMKLT